MYEKTNITENHLNMLSIFTQGYDREYYIRETQKILKIAASTAQVILEDLEKKTLLESKLKGKIRTYKLRNIQITREYLILAEQHKKIIFLEKNAVVSEVVSKIEPLIRGMALIFGSYANGTNKKDSDLDLFVMGDCNLKEMMEISEAYRIELSVKMYPKAIFDKKMHQDILIKEVIGNHVIVKGTEEFVKTVLKE